MSDTDHDSPSEILGEMDLVMGAARLAFQRYEELRERLAERILRLELEISLFSLELKELTDTSCKTCGFDECRCGDDWQNVDGPHTLPDIEGR